jgi:hypothetical protein
VLDQAAALEHGHLREIVSHVHAHEVATKGPTVTLLAPTPGDQFGVDFFGAALGAAVASAI